MAASIEIKVPDIGDFKDVEVIELLVKPGETITQDQSLITVESDKASMEIPSSHAGVLEALSVKIGDKISQGSTIARVKSDAAAGAANTSDRAAAPNPVDVAVAAAAAPATATAAQSSGAAANAPSGGAAPSTSSAPSAGAAAASTAPSGTQRSSVDVQHAPGQPIDLARLPHASPAVRKFARELGVDLARVAGSGPNGRITADDVRAHVKAALASPAPAAAGAGMAVLAWPKVDFEKFGPIERQDLSRIRKISGPSLHRNWVTIPHVTNHDDADVTDLEAFRVKLNEENARAGVKLTMLAFLVKACVSALKKFPQFNASLDGEQVVIKQYWHIGFAADTPNGLVVPVVRNADQKGLFDIAAETAALAAKARDGKLAPSDMQGGTFSISSLGGIGGRYFTPIINAPEVAILGVCRTVTQPVWDGHAFAPRLMLPLSLSWDHRVVDGAAAARFNAYLGQVLADFRRVLL